MRRRGITLVELLLALSISVLVMMAAGNAYVIGLRNAKTLGDGRAAIAKRAAFEATLTDVFDHAYVDPDVTDTASYFLSGDAVSSSTASTSAPSLGGSGGASSGSGDNSSVVFTVLGRRPPSSLLASQNDFETNNESFGPVAGSTEIQLGTSAVGQPSSDQQGLFLREQSPSDGDPTQGGTESLLGSDVQTVAFEFYDGTAWQTTWDTNTMTPRRLPSAVRVTYRLKTDTGDTVAVFALPNSDVTTDNPVVQSTTTTTGTTG